MELHGKIVLITGCSSGIGLESAVGFAVQGARVYATMRDTTKKGDLLKRAKEEHVTLTVLALDVTDDASMRKAIKEIVRREKRIDVLVNNAGYGLLGPLTDLRMEDIRAQYETNVFGLIACSQLCIPYMGEGSRILNVSSVVGHLGIPMMGAYCSTKFAVEGITEAMRRELYRKGIYVVSVKPGSTRTDFGSRSLKIGFDTKTETGKQILQFRKRFTKRTHFNDSARTVANDIIRIAKKRSPSLRYGVGIHGTTIRTLLRVCPDWLIDMILRNVL